MAGTSSNRKRFQLKPGERPPMPEYLTPQEIAYDNALREKGRIAALKKEGEERIKSQLVDLHNRVHDLKYGSTNAEVVKAPPPRPSRTNRRL